jgi:SHAQKYF class myb-like DNA-binding protein
MGKKTGQWSKFEHKRFVAAIHIFGNFDFKNMVRYIGTRSNKQIRSHRKKYFIKI